MFGIGFVLILFERKNKITKSTFIILCEMYFIRKSYLEKHNNNISSPHCSGSISFLLIVKVSFRLVYEYYGLGEMKVPLILILRKKLE